MLSLVRSHIGLRVLLLVLGLTLNTPLPLALALAAAHCVGEEEEKREERSRLSASLCCCCWVKVWRWHASLGLPLLVSLVPLRLMSVTLQSPIWFFDVYNGIPLRSPSTRKTMQRPGAFVVCHIRSLYGLCHKAQARITSATG